MSINNMFYTTGPVSNDPNDPDWAQICDIIHDMMYMEKTAYLKKRIPIEEFNKLDRDEYDGLIGDYLIAEWPKEHKRMEDSNNNWDVSKYLKEKIVIMKNNEIYDSDIIDDYTHAIDRIEELERILGNLKNEIQQINNQSRMALIELLPII